MLRGQIGPYCMIVDGIAARFVDVERTIGRFGARQLQRQQPLVRGINAPELTHTRRDHGIAERPQIVSVLRFLEAITAVIPTQEGDVDRHL